MSRGRLLQLLDEQLAFLDASCVAYDDGVEAECKRLATHIRTLVHDTKQSRSLLGQIGVKGDLWFFDPMLEKRARLAQLSQTGAIVFHRGGLAVVTMGPTATGARYVPRALGEELDSERMSRFDDWWALEALFPLHGDPPSRRHLVLWLANKDGGTHVDTLPPTYVELTTGAAMGLTFPTTPAKNSPIPACIRQIAEELRRSVRAQRELIEAVAAAGG